MQVNNKNLERECQISLIFKSDLENTKLLLKRSLTELVIKNQQKHEHSWDNPDIRIGYFKK